MFIPNTQIEAWIEEDVPGFDLTSHLLEMNSYSATLTLQARHDTILRGSEEAAAMFTKLGAIPISVTASGTQLSEGDPILTVTGKGDQLHAGWRVALNLLEFASGISTRTHHMVTEAQKRGQTRMALP